MESYKWREALADPGRFFDTPAAVCDTTSRTDSEKIELLQAWERNTRQLMVAEGEGLSESFSHPDQCADLLQAIHAALTSLGAPHRPENAQSDVTGSTR